MCGIFGFNWADNKLIKKGTRIIAHRGPDDEGYYTDSNISLGMRRLAIIDLKGGKQPVHNEDETIWIIFNGEIYNYKELRNKLKNHKFYTNSDTEVIVHAYEEWGENFVKKLNGMFAIALWDTEKKQLLVYRDMIGIKPVYYYYMADKLLFASEIKCIFQYERIKKELDESELASYLKFGYCLNNGTLFKNVKKLLPGTYLKLKDNKIAIKRYWDIQEKLSLMGEQYFIKKIRQILEASVRHQMIADVPIGVILSGGIDSSTITALAKKYINYELHTFSAGFENYFSELDHARIVSEYVGTTHHEINVTEKDAMNNFKKITWHHDEPIADAAVIPRYFLAKEAKDYVKVVLSGEGGDEVFGGYDNYRMNLRFYKYFQQKAKVGIFNRLQLAFPLNINPQKNRILNAVEFISKKDFASAHLHSTSLISEGGIKWLAKFKFSNIDNKALFPKNINDPLNFMLAIDIKNLLPGDYLMKADKSTMANSIEERVPFLDLNIINLSFKIPYSIKIKNDSGKHLLKQSIKDLLPKSVIERKKQGFGTPIASWIAGEMKETIFNTLEENEIIREYFNEKKIIKITKSYNNGNQLNSCIWSLFALGKWHEVFFTD